MNRSDFPIFKQNLNGFPLCYVDSASTTQKPQQVLDKLMNFYTTSYANIYRGTHGFGERATTEYEKARETVARWIGARNPREIVFTKGTTAGINAFATAWGCTHLKEGDEIVLTELEHHSNLVPWQEIAQHTGAQLKFIPVGADGLLKLENLDEIITSKTKLVAAIHVSNAIGTQVPIKTLIAAAQVVGAKTLIDAAQSVPNQPLNVSELGCDVLVFSGHKMLAPTGVGVLYINHTLFDQMPPYQFGGGMVYECTFEKSDFLPPPQKYEAGTPPFVQAIALRHAIEYLEDAIDFTQLQPHSARLCAQLIEGIQNESRIRILGPVDELKEQGHLVSFVVDGVHAHDVAAFLDAQGICVRAGHHCAQSLAKILDIDASVRASFYLYNDESDVERVIQAVKKLLKTW